jgi:site-specific recombinase XerD
MALVRRKGIWYVQKEIDGKKYRKSTKQRDRKLAERLEPEILRQFWSGTFEWKARKVPTFRGWAERYQVAYTARKRAPWRDRQILAHALPALGTMRLDHVTRSNCHEYLACRAATGVSPWTVNREHGLLRAMWNAAIEDGLIAKNPWSKLKRMHAEPRSRVLDVAETQRLLAAVNPEYGRFVTVVLGTGLRMREMLGLTPEDIVIEREELRVRSETAKWGHSRIVPLRSEVREALEGQIAARQVDRGQRL